MASLEASIERRIRDLRDFQIPRLKECSTTALQNELTGELRNDLAAVKALIDHLEGNAADEENEGVRDQLQKSVTRFTTELSRTRASYREAVLSSSRAIKESSARSSLRQNSTNTTEAEEQPVSHDDDSLQAKTNEVTDALRRTMMTMQQELERSVLATQMLDESSNTLRSTQTMYDRYDNLLTTASRLVKQLEKADWYDRLIIMLALAFFLLVVGFIIKRRVLDKAARGVSWWVGGTAKLLLGRGKWKSPEEMKGIPVKASQGAQQVTESVTRKVPDQVIPTMSEAFQGAVSNIAERPSIRATDEL